MSTQNLHMYIYRGFIHNCQNLGETKMPQMSGIINWYIQAVEHYSI